MQKVYLKCILIVCFMLYSLDEDEDGDRITVRSDEELRAMIDVSFQSIWRLEVIKIYPSDNKPQRAIGEILETSKNMF